MKSRHLVSFTHILCYLTVDYDVVFVQAILIDLVTVFDAILTGGQTPEKLHLLCENLLSNNLRRTAVLKKIMICKLKLHS